MIIDDVEKHGQAVGMAGIHQALELFRPAVGMMRRVKVHPVVTQPRDPENSFTGINSKCVTPSRRDNPAFR